jgi:hypothetical protein
VSLAVTIVCNGHRHGQPCRSSRSSSLAYSPTLRSDDPTRPAITPALLEGWRIGAAPGGGDLCPSSGHDEDRRPDPLEQAAATLAARRANEGLS